MLVAMFRSFMARTDHTELKSTATRSPVVQASLGLLEDQRRAHANLGPGAVYLRAFLVDLARLSAAHGFYIQGQLHSLLGDGGHGDLSIALVDAHHRSFGSRLAVRNLQSDVQG